MDKDVITAAPGTWRHLGLLLGDAFQDDPIWMWIAPDQRRRSAHLGTMFAQVIRPRVEEGLAYTTTDDGGAAVWSPPNRWRMSWREALMGLVPSIRTVGVGRIRRGLEALGRIERLHPREPHWYLEFLAAHVDRRGQGYGSALLAPMLYRADLEGMPCHLESSKPENLPFYERFGFEVTGEFRIGDGSPPMWSMWREPRDPRDGKRIHG